MKSPTLFRGTDKSLWNFWEHGVTSSFLNAFLTCMEQTRLAYVEGWTSRQVPLAFEFGTCCHWVLEQVYGEPGNWPELESGRDREDAIEAMVEAYEGKWLLEVDAPTKSQLEQQELVYGMAEAVLPAYFDRWEGDFTGAYRYPNSTTAPVKWQSLEQVFDLPYMFPDGKQTHLRGRRDGVFTDSRNRFWVFDTKCRSILNHDDAIETLPLDLQQMFYLHATHIELGAKKVAGTIMNIIKRPGLYRRKDEPLQVYIGRITEHCRNDEHYGDYFNRYEMAVAPSEVLFWKKWCLDPIMQAVRMWWEGDLPHYMNPNALLSKYGRCNLFLPIVRKEFDFCYKREKPFNEL